MVCVSERQHVIFDQFFAKQKHTVSPMLYFRHYLEDYLEGNQVFMDLWKFLSCNQPIPKEMVKKLT